MPEGGERKDREERREIAAADRRTVHRDKDRRPRDVQQGADVQQQIPRAVAVAGAVEIEQHLGEGVGQDDTDQSDGRDAHAQHDRGRDHAACTQCTDVVQQQQRQERLKQVEHRVREHPADIEAVRGVQDEAVLTSSAATSRLTTLSRRRNIRLFRSSICRWREYCHMTTSSTAIPAIR